MKKSDSEIIKAHIKRLHDKNSGDYESLISQIEKRRRISLNLPQLLAYKSFQKLLVLIWGRGTGKTTQLGIRIQSILSEMPRSTGLFIGPSYQAILTRIIPSFIQGLEMLGIYDGLHYFIGRQPPQSWRKTWGSAFQPPKRWNNYITFYNGMGIHLISQDVAGDGRGLNTDFIIGDEAALLSQKKLESETDPTLRGTNKNAFQKSQYFGSKMYTTSMPLTADGEFILDYIDKAKEAPNDIAVISATCMHNAHNLREGFLKEAEQTALAQWIFDAEYKNIRPNFAGDSFYAMLNESIHCYQNQNNGHYLKLGQIADCRGDEDLISSNHLILGMDWGAAINCMTVSQHIKSFNEFRTIKDFYVLGADQKIQDDLLQDFHDYYQYHQSSNNLLELYYDNTGNLSTGHTRKTRAEQAQAYLVARGWRVSLMTTGRTNPEHSKKHLLWEGLLKGNIHGLPIYRINKINARNTYLSMRYAKTKAGSKGEIKKDKRSERSKKIPRQNATDLSDAQDAPIFQRYYRLLRFGAGSLPPIKPSN